MKIIMGKADDGGCGFYRVILPAMELSKRGHDVSITSSFNIPSFKGIDILVLQRQIEEKKCTKLIERAHRHGTKVVYDMDDAFWCIPKYNPAYKYYNEERKSAMREIIKACDYVTVSTYPLAEALIKWLPFEKAIDVLPNCMPKIAFKKAIPVPSKFRIVIAGSPTHLEDWRDAILKASEIVHTLNDTELFIIGLDKEDLPTAHDHESIHYIPMFKTMGDYMGFLNSMNFSVGLAPLLNNKFNKCKSDCKVLEYISAGIYPLASKVQPYIDSFGSKVEHLVDSKESWYTRILTVRTIMKEAYGEYKRTIKNLQSKKEEESIEETIYQWEVLYDSLLRRPN